MVILARGMYGRPPFLEMHYYSLLSTFSLERKSGAKSSSEFDARQFLKSKSPLTNSHLVDSFIAGTLSSNTLLRVIRRN
jgi:hypothetical protein